MIVFESKTKTMRELKSSSKYTSNSPSNSTEEEQVTLSILIGTIFKDPKIVA